MSKKIFIICFVLFNSIHTGQPSDKPIVLVGVDVLTMSDSGMLSDQTVIINKGLIKYIGDRANTKIPDSAKIIEAQNKILMPGFIDVHVHFRQADTTVLINYLKNGITTVRDMNGRPTLLEWRKQILSGKLIGPTMKVACPTIANWSSPKEGYPTPKTEQEGRDLVKRFYEDGYDLIKVYTFLGKDAYMGIIDEAKKIGLPVSGHVPIDTGIVGTITSGIYSIEHMTEYIGSSLTPESQKLDDKDYRAIFGAGEINWKKIDSLISITKTFNVWNVPTLVWFDRNLPAPVAKESWDNESLRNEGSLNRRELVRHLHNAGALLAIGTDSDNGRNLEASAFQDELIAMSEAGLSSYEVLHTATVKNATLMNILSETGTVTVGKRADLLLLSEDPLKDLNYLKNLEIVIARGNIIYVNKK